MATNSSIVREGYSNPPSHKDSGKSLPLGDHKISFRHPGYDDSGNVLLSMTALDPGGIHHATAKVACGIIADNRWDGYFTTDQAGRTRVEDSPEKILLGQDYYFHLPNLTGKLTT